MGKLLLENARVYTMATPMAHSPAPAVLLADGRVAATGPAATLAAALSPGDGRIDLGGLTVVPGFTDAHVHLLHYGFNLQAVDLVGATGLADALHRVAAGASRLAPGDWLQGWGCDFNRWERWPDRHDLDRICPQVPVLLHTKDGHTAWVNSLALRLAEVDGGTPDPPGGAVWRGSDGEPLGLLQENAISLVKRVVPPRGDEETVGAVRVAMAAALAAGCTAVHDVDGQASLTALRRIHSAEGLPLRVVSYLEDAALDTAIALGLRSGSGDDWLRVGGIKIFSDGSLGSQTAWMLTPWENRPQYHGLPTHSPAALKALVERAAAHGLACAVHAIGDAANRQVLDVFAGITAASRRQGLRHRIEHAQHVDPADRPRFRQLGVAASVQPSHVLVDRELVERHLGPERGRWSHAYGSLLRAGATLACGSDAPVEPVQPLLGLFAAVHRRHPDGAGAPWQPQECLTPTAALYGFTAAAAWVGGMDPVHGRLVPGLSADLAVLSHDPVAGAAADLAACRVVATLVAGRVVAGELPPRRRV